MDKSDLYSSFASRSLCPGQGAWLSSFFGPENDMHRCSGKSDRGNRLLAILEAAEDIVSETTSYLSQIQTRRCQDIDLEPTPLGDEGVKILTTEIPFEEALSMDEDQADLFVDLLNPMTAQPPAAKRPRKSRTAVDHATAGSHPTMVPSTGPPARAITPPAQASVVHPGSEEARFRSYQFGQWNKRFQELTKFRNEHGHCLVPHSFPENPQLAQWVKRQRYQHKLKRLNRHSTLTDEREAALEKMGFAWDSHNSAWIEHLESLKRFRARHGHTNVPSNFIDRSLAIWVKCQRRQHRLFQKGARSTLTPERFLQLEQLHFDWNPRNLYR